MTATPGAGSSPNWVTVGPELTSITRAWMLKLASVSSIIFACARTSVWLISTGAAALNSVTAGSRQICAPSGRPGHGPGCSDSVSGSRLDGRLRRRARVGRALRTTCESAPASGCELRCADADGP